MIVVALLVVKPKRYEYKTFVRHYKTFIEFTYLGMRFDNHYLAVYVQLSL